MASPQEYGRSGTPLQHTRHSMILERINNGEELSITALSREWGVATKTLQRDFDKLNTVLPGHIERASDGKRYRRSKKGTTNNDAELIIDMLDSLVSGIGGNIYTKANKLLRELKAHIDKPFYTRLDVEDISDKLDVIAFLDKQIANQKSISFKYNRWDKDGENKTYSSVMPLKIVVYGGFWYLLAEHHQRFKKFYLKSIFSCVDEDKSFTPNSEILDKMENSVNIWFEPNNKPFEVTLWVDKKAVVYFERKPISKRQKLYKKPDGTAELVIKATHEKEVFPILKFWMPSVRILEPIELQEKFNDMLQSYFHADLT